MSKNKHVVKGFLLLFAVVFATAIFGGSAHAATTNGIITDSNNIRWEYVYDDNESSVVTIKFYDKPANLTTVTVPSLSQLRSLVPGAGSIQTYILTDADVEAQNRNYPDLTRREATASTIKLDMSNTSTIQIHGVKPIIDPEVETELVFGSNMVLGDVPGKSVTTSVCTGTLTYSSWNSAYSCWPYESRTFEDFEGNIAGWEDMTEEQKNAYQPTPADFGCVDVRYANPATDAAGVCYITNWTSDYYTSSKTIRKGRAFAGYKLKLTNFGDFNYVGWETFADSTLADTTMTIDQSGLEGGNIFRNTNLKEVTVETMKVGAGLFRDCALLRTVHFADTVDRIPDDMFAGTGLTSIDFSQTLIKTIGPRAFEGAHLTSVNFDGVNKIEYGAFRNNNIGELTMPKSINYLESDLFYGNVNIKKVTIAYDTLTSGTTLPFFVVADGSWRGKYDQNAALNHVEELTVLAPYAADEEVSETHISYDDYRWRYNCYTQERLDADISTMNYRISDRDGNIHDCSAAANGYGMVNYVRGLNIWSASQENAKFEDDFANVAAYKNVIAPIYFYNFDALKKITIGDGYEYVGSSAFWSQPSTDFGADVWDIGYGNQRSISSLTLPEGLKGIGNLAFGYLSKVDISINLPSSLEFIGQSAFTRTYYMKNDIDLPNLKYIGDHAFAGTMVHDVYLHDTTKYLGYNAFWGDMNLNNITIDFDFFNPNIENWTLRGITDGDNYSYKSLWFGRMFGNPYSNYLSTYGGRCDVETHLSAKGFRCDIAGGYDAMKYGTITFTNKNVSPFPSTVGDKDSISYSGEYSYGTLRDTLFGFDFFADKVDLGKAGWKVLPSGTFGYYSRIGEVVLPENLEVIGRDAFNGAWIDEEITIPDSVKIIGDMAFNPMAAVKNMDYGTYKDYTTPKISKLPSSLEYVGFEAFYGDDNLTADLNAPNLKYVGARAFQGTKLRDVYLGEVQSLREGTFANIPTLRNITIDTDFGSAVTAEVDTSFTIPQSLLDVFGGDEVKAKNAVVSKGIHDGHGQTYQIWNPTTRQNEDRIRYIYGKDFETFYTIFSKTMKESSPGTRDGQATAGEEFGILKFTEKNTTDLTAGMIGAFSYLSFEEVDLSATDWKQLPTSSSAFRYSHIGTLKLPAGLKTVTSTSFEHATIDNEFALPETLTTIGRGAFQWASANITNALPESVKVIDSAAFYSSDFTDNLTIPGGVTMIGWSAFNAGDTDVHYDTITIEPSFTSAKTNGQLVHQMFWQADVDKMTVKSSSLVGYERADTSGNEEFWHMPFDEIEITNLPKITFGAFNGCTNLTKVDASKDTALRIIRPEAFMNDEKLEQVLFAPALKNETVTMGIRAFKNTGFKTIGKSGADFNLYAAHFDAEPSVFSYMKKLKRVDVPETFSNGVIPVDTFYNDAELEEASIAYKVKMIGNAAFANDNKLKRIFIWGDTAVQDTNLPGYTMPDMPGMGSDSDEEGNTAPTIPEKTDIYAYSSWHAEPYAASQARKSFEGDFYPLDEVLYLTTNKTHVKVNDDSTDWDKDGLIVYGLRRDGIVLESDQWGEFDGNVYPRNQKDLSFGKMTQAIMENPEFATVWDTPVPANELSLVNENFENIDYELVNNEEGIAGLKRINIIYTDAYTGGEPDTDVLPLGDTPEIPKTLDNIAGYLGIIAGAGAAGVALIVLSRKALRRR